MKTVVTGLAEPADPVVAGAIVTAAGDWPGLAERRVEELDLAVRAGDHDVVVDALAVELGVRGALEVVVGRVELVAVLAAAALGDDGAPEPLGRERGAERPVHGLRGRGGAPVRVVCEYTTAVISSTETVPQPAPFR